MQHDPNDPCTFTYDARIVQAAKRLGIGVPSREGIELTLVEALLAEQYAYAVELSQRAKVHEGIAQQGYTIGGSNDNPLRRIVAERSLAAMLQKHALEYARDAEEKAQTLRKKKEADVLQFPKQKKPAETDLLNQILASQKFGFTRTILETFETLNLKTLRDLVLCSPQMLLSQRGFGPKSLTKVSTVLTELGLQLGMKETVSLQGNNIVPLRRKET
jgi:hypothetical protein